MIPLEQLVYNDLYIGVLLVLLPLFLLSESTLLLLQDFLI